MRSRLLALAATLLVAAGARAQTGARPMVYVETGVLRPSGGYDGSAVAPGALTVTVGGEIPVARREALTGTLGAALRFAAMDAYGVNADDEASSDPVFESGFHPQHLDLYGRAAGHGLAATLGFVFDLGSGQRFASDDQEDDPAFFNSDLQHAVRFGLDAERRVGAATLAASAEGFLTVPDRYEIEVVPGEGSIPDSVDTIRGSFDYGNTFVARVGATYPAGVVELGLDVIYVGMGGFHTETAPAIEPPHDGRSSYVLSLAPRVVFVRPASRARIELAARAPGAWYNEHVTYGVTLAGERQPKVRVPLTLRIQVGL